LSNYGALLPDLYRLDAINGWSIGMRAITHALLAQVPLPPGPILEIGCGSGLFNAELRARYPQATVYGMDLHPLALAYAAQATPTPPTLLRGDLQRLPVAESTMSAVLALDVFDQQGVDLRTALAESWRILQPHGMLILRVSAHPWLEGEHDAAFNTGRRYRRSELVELLAQQRFTVQRVTYTNSLLSPPLVAVRLLQRWGWLTLDETAMTGSTANTLFQQALQAESHWLRHRDFAFGISLYVIAQKQSESPAIPPTR
jgi:ubiquinone/menaquinone biosynthesis C-methylase UbiE